MAKSRQKYQKKGSQLICLIAILIDSVFRSGKSYYPQVFLQECKYVVIEKKIPKYILTIQKFLQILKKKFLMKKILVKKILMKKILLKGIKKIFFSIIFFSIYKNGKNVLSKTQGKTSKRST